MPLDRYRKTAGDLQEGARLLRYLSHAPDRVTEKDFFQAIFVMERAATDLVELIRATPPGCVCLHIKDDNYDYLDYAESCSHHRQLYILRESLKARYAKAESVLKNEARMKIITAALTGTAALSARIGEQLVECAITIADEAISQITRDA